MFNMYSSLDKIQLFQTMYDLSVGHTWNHAQIKLNLIKCHCFVYTWVQCPVSLDLMS